MKLLLNEAVPATQNFELNNQEALKTASNLEISEIQNKLKQCFDILHEMQDVLNNFTLVRIDNYNYEKNKTEINRIHTDLNHIVSEIKKKQW